MRQPVRPNSLLIPEISGELVKQHCHIAFVFTKLNLVAWRDILPLLKRRATVFAYNPENTAAYVGFVVTPDNCRKVAEIAHRAYSMRGVYVNIPGTDIETMNDVSPWLHCWLESFAFKNKTEYCSVPDYDPQLCSLGMAGYRDYLDKPVSESEWRLTLPCKCAWPRNLTSDNPKQFMRECLEYAHAKGCDRCPLFSIARFRADTVKGRRSNAVRLDGDGMLQVDVMRLIKDSEK